MSAATLEWPVDYAGSLTGIDKDGKKVAICTPCLVKPLAENLAALEAEVPLLEAAGWDDYAVWQIGCPYISAARSLMLRKALDAKADVVVFLDYDLSWTPGTLLKLIETEGDVVAGTYRYKRDPEEYMGALLPGPDQRPQVREDGAVRAFCVPAGFLKVTRKAVNTFMREWPELCYGEPSAPHVDLFNHGAHGSVWWGEDYAFSRRWREKCGDIWIVPDLDLNHHGATIYMGNFHRFLLRQPGGSEDPYRVS